MERTRRGLLSAAIAAGIAGCLGVDGVTYPDRGPVEEAFESDAAVTDDDVESAADVGRDDERLADATRRVVDDALWFATEYDAAIEAYRDAIGDVVDDAEDVETAARKSATATVEYADRLASSGYDAAERAGDVLEPHFTPRPRIERRTENHTTVLRRFAERDDVDRFLEELDRMRSWFAAAGTRRYTDRAFSRNPIHNRLLRRLLYPLPSDPEDREEILDNTLVELAVADEGLATVAHRPYDDDRFDRSELPRIYGDPIGAERRSAFRERLGPVVQPDDRVAELFFVFGFRPLPDEGPDDPFEGWYHELDGTMVHVQRYPDARTAADRLGAVTTAGSTEDDEPIDPESDRVDGRDAATHWHRYLHDAARGERFAADEYAGVQYGYVTRAGEFLLATGFSGDAWEERLGWQGRLTNGWAIV